jgi:hypothetical protein
MHSIGIGFRVFYFQYYTNIAKKIKNLHKKNTKFPTFFGSKYNKILQNKTLTGMFWNKEKNVEPQPSQNVLLLLMENGGAAPKYWHQVQGLKYWTPCDDLRFLLVSVVYAMKTIWSMCRLYTLWGLVNILNHFCDLFGPSFVPTPKWLLLVKHMLGLYVCSNPSTSHNNVPPFSILATNFL